MSGGPLIVQSDKTVLLEVDHEQAGAARAAIAPFAELERAPEHIHTYRLTPLGLWNARAAGHDAEQVVDALVNYSRYPVPQPLLVGALIGLFAGYFGGRTDTVLMRLTDAQLSIPMIILAITILGVSRPTIPTIILVLGLAGWPVYARVMRSTVMSERKKEYVRGAMVLGAVPLALATGAGAESRQAIGAVIVGGMLLSMVINGCNYVDSQALVIGFMALAFFGKGIGALGWAVVSDTSPKEAGGVSGGLFNTFGNLSSITTPIIIGYIFAATGSFNSALVFVGANALVAAIGMSASMLVSGRIKMTGSPVAARRCAVPESKVARPTAIPPEAPIPAVMAGCAGSSDVSTSVARSMPAIVSRACSRVISPSCTRSIAIRNAARGVRLAERV